jgi:hypothetical protein
VDLFRSRGPFICYGHTSDPRSRTVFIHQDPELTVLVTRASRVDHSLRERTSFDCLRGTRGQYSIKLRACVRRARTFFVRADHSYVMGRPLTFTRGPLSFIGTPSRLFWSLAFHGRTILSASGPFSIASVAHVDSILSNVRTSARRMRTFFVLADLLYVMCGPLSYPRGPFSFIGTPSGLFWSLALGVRTILSASGPFSIASVAHVDSILSN